MRVWIDITNSPHVPFFRPLIRLLEEDGHEVEVTAREYAQTLELLAAARDRAPRRRAAARRRRRARQGARAGRAAARAAPLREEAPVRPRARARLARADAGRAQPRDPERHRTSTTSSRRCSTSSGCRAATRVVVPGGDPAPTASPASAPSRRSSSATPGIKEEYYLADFEPDHGVPSSRRSTRRRVLVVVRHAARGLALPPARQPALRATCSSGSAATRACTPSCSRAPPSSAPTIRALGLPSLHRPGARRRRAEPDRARRPRRLGRRNDEPRGGGARDARLHDVRGPARRGRRAADPRRPAPPAHRPAARSTCASATRGGERRRGAIRSSARPAPQRFARRIGVVGLPQTFTFQGERRGIRMNSVAESADCVAVSRPDSRPTCARPRLPAAVRRLQDEPGRDDRPGRRPARPTSRSSPSATRCRTATCSSRSRTGSRSTATAR